MKSSNPIVDKILTAAKARMVRFGYHKVTMDEIAADLRMSKNTIYLHFPGKIAIAKALVARIKNRINDHQGEIENKEKDPLKIISLNILFLQQELAPWFEFFLKDIQLELPELWQEFVDFRTEKVMELEKLVDVGIKKGKFRQVNPTLAVRAYLGAVNNIINPEILQQEGITFQQALETVMDIWSKGIVKEGKK
ncbi:MAG: TetR/AcrR family transcriptional regulator [Candidatus Omnitrophica bacterium]|nr:TetR/AcrR family transcriptional regulator [Candidatus Omnitrophota bacterium]